MASITISFDAGTSGSKIIANYPASGGCVFNDENYFLVKPAVRELTEKTYYKQLEYVDEGIGLSSSLVSYIDPLTKDWMYWEVGESATRLGQLSVKERKFETLVVKVLAFLGYLVNGSAPTSERVGLSLGVLLPLDEIGDRKVLAERLRTIIGGGFSVNGYVIKNVAVERINCKPEGYGIYKSYPNPKAGILMVGHSDLSWLYFNQGAFVVSKSRTFPSSGMHSFIKSIDFPTQYELVTAEIIAKAGAKLDPKVLRELTQTKNEDEIAYLIEEIKLARPQYWKERTKELEQLDIKLAGAICAAGGAANYFAEELNQLFKEKFVQKLNWCKTLRGEFVKHFEIKSADKSIVPLFLDCYGYYQTLALPKIELINSQAEESRKVWEVVQNASN